MALQLALALVGLVIGVTVMDSGGWLVGALIGFLFAQVMQMDETIKRQANKIQLLESMQTYLDNLLQNLNTGNTSVPGDADTKTTQTTHQDDSKPVEPPQAEIPGKAVETFDLSLPDDFVTPVAAQSSEIKKPFEQPSPAITDQVHTNNKKPSLEEKATRAIRDFFLKGNPVVRVGMLVLFFGLSFLVNYAASQGYFPIELRLLCVVAIALVLIVIGWHTRAREGGYGLVLQGGGLAALYLTCFAAAKMYEVIPSSLSLFFLLVFVVFGVALALLQNAQVLAVMAIAGGFLAPILTSDGSNNYVGLFSIYLVLNFGVLLVSWFRAWRLLNWIGFVFTFVITTYWGVLRYEPQFYANTQPFLIAFFLMYLTISILFSIRQPLQLKGLVDGSLVFGLPVAAFTLQAALLKHTEYGVAISSLILALIYIGLARWLWAQYRETHQTLVESFLALGTGFATLAIPLALNSDWTSAAWAFEAAGLLWVGLRQQRRLARAAGIILYFAACIASLVNPLKAGGLPIIQGDFIGLVILAFTAALMSFHYSSYQSLASELEKFIGKLFFPVAILWWMTALILELDGHLAEKTAFAAFYLAVAFSMLCQYPLAKKFNWSIVAYGHYVYFAAIVCWTLYGMLSLARYPTAYFFALPFIIYAFAHYTLLYKMEKDEHKNGLEIMHLSSGLWILLLLLWQVNGVINKGIFLDLMTPGLASLFVWFIASASTMACVIYINKKSLWPANNWQNIYRNWIPLPYMLLLAIWLLRSLGESGVIKGFYLPLLNPADLAYFAVILLLGYAFKHNLAFTGPVNTRSKQVFMGLLVFVWINLMLLRSLHHYLVIPYEWRALWNSEIVQMSLSILWTLCALLCMNIARRMQRRNLWIAGAILIGLVLVKLFTKDLSSSGTLAQVVSFMGVGGLILLIGYLSPIPPAKNSGEKV